MKNGCIGEMKHIVKSIAIWVADIVRQRVTDKYSFPLKMALSTAALFKFDLEVQGKPLFVREVTVERWQMVGVRTKKTSACLVDVHTNNVGEVDRRCL